MLKYFEARFAFQNAYKLDPTNLQYGTSVHLSHSRRVKYALGVQYCGYLLVVMGVIAAILLLLDVVPLR